MLQRPAEYFMITVDGRVLTHQATAIMKMPRAVSEAACGQPVPATLEPVSRLAGTGRSFLRSLNS